MWIEILCKEVSQKGIKQVAKELGISRTTIYLVLEGKYKASTAKVEEKVMQIYGNNGFVECPVMGKIPPAVCADKWRLAMKIGMRAGNPETLKLYKACLGCKLRQ